MSELASTSEEATEICTRCVMTRAVDTDIVFVDGVCNHCRRYDRLLPSRVLTGAEGREALEILVGRMRAARSRKGYDCVVGVSGGVDSTYVAMWAKTLGLNPLAVHVDNGWNSEVAVANIEKTLKKLDIDLQTEVLDLREFYDLQRSFLYASTPDGDVPADHAIQATLWKAARKNRVRFIVSGMNFRTESVLVHSWSYGHSDWRYLKAVHKRHGKRALKTFPHFGFIELFYTNVIRRIRTVSILNYVDYDKAVAMRELTEALDWTPYGGKHYESIYTRWYQGYVLPQKFGIDKRRGHLSDLINSGEMTRDEALRTLDMHDYDERLRQQDQTLVLKKLQLTEAEFAEIMALPTASFRDYPNAHAFVQRLRDLANWLRSKGLYPR